MRKEIKYNRVIFMGIGIFLLIIIDSISSLFEHLTFDLLIYLNAKPIIIFWSKIITRIILYFILYSLGVNLIDSTEKSAKKILISMIYVFIIISTIVTIYLLAIRDLFRTENTLENLGTFIESADSFYMQKSIIEILGFLIYLIPAIIIYKKTR